MPSKNQENKTDPVGYRVTSIRVDDAKQIEAYCKTRKRTFGKKKPSCIGCIYSSRNDIGCIFARQPDTWRTNIDMLIL